MLKRSIENENEWMNEFNVLVPSHPSLSADKFGWVFILFISLRKQNENVAALKWVLRIVYWRTIKKSSWNKSNKTNSEEEKEDLSEFL